MRITPEQISTIVQTTRSIAGVNAQVWLFGSRLDDARKGGDIDLLIESVPVAGTLARWQHALVPKSGYLSPLPAPKPC